MFDPKYAQLIFSCLMALFMSCIMALRCSGAAW